MEPSAQLWLFESAWTTIEYVPAGMLVTGVPSWPERVIVYALGALGFETVATSVGFRGGGGSGAARRAMRCMARIVRMCDDRSQLFLRREDRIDPARLSAQPRGGRLARGV